MHNMKTLFVAGVRMRYVDAGKGPAILLLHGNPTSSYLWRNITPQLKKQGRCIAPDLVGMGASDQPPLPCRFEDHYHFLNRFIETIGLEEIHLVMHDWGSALGFYYAMNHPEKIRSMAWMEGLVKPWSWGSLKWQYRLGFGLLRMPIIGEALIYGLNAFLTLIMPRLIYRKLSRKEWRHYKEPFRNITSRKPMLMWPREIPINGRPARTYRIVWAYSSWLQQTSIPKLLIYATPGAIINQETLKWCRYHIKNLETKHIGEGLHYLQEDHPRAIAQTLSGWIQKQIAS